MQRIGNAVLERCPRWLIGVQGVGKGSGECQQAGGVPCWWGENVIGHLEAPVVLSKPHKVVLMPHTYGHGQQSYMDAPDLCEAT